MDTWDPIAYYLANKKTPGNQPLSADEQATLLGMSQDQVDVLIDLDYRAWDLHGNVRPSPPKTGMASLDEAAAAWAASTDNAIKRVGAASY